MSIREHNIQNEIRAWCGEHGIMCFRCNVGKVQCIDGTWFDTGLPDGFSDLIILPGNGKIIFCEVKTKQGYQRQCQRDFEDAVTAAGYTYFVARGIDDVIKIIYNNTGGN